MKSINPKFLVIAQDLRISGTSEGVVSRSFLARLNQIYPKSIIDVIYLKNHTNNDKLELLPVSSIKSFYIPRKIPWYIIWINKIWWRLTGLSLNDSYHLKKYGRIISQIDYRDYDTVFLRSSGQEFEVIRASRDLPILKKSIINFHDPYPIAWDTGSNRLPRKTEFGQFREIWDIVRTARACITPSKLLSQDLENLYGSSKNFYILPHQFVPEVFEKCSEDSIRKKEKKISISYHGALQLGRDLRLLLEAYNILISEFEYLKINTELVLRLRGGNIREFKSKYASDNIKFLKVLDFARSSLEQKQESDILVILDNCSAHSNILAGKAPFLASLQKPVLALTPERSEIRRILISDDYAANCIDQTDVQNKLKNLVDKLMEGNNITQPFGDYFDLNNFRNHLSKILK